MYTKPIDQFVDQMIENSNLTEDYGVPEVTRLECEEIIAPVRDNIADLKENFESFAEKLYQLSGIEAALQELIVNKKLAAGAVLAFGTAHTKKIVVCGNQQEVVYDFDKNIFYEQIEPMRKNSIFDLASVTKLFTCVIVLKLVEYGRLKLDGMVGEYTSKFSNISSVKIIELMDFSTELVTDQRITQYMSRMKAEELIFHIKALEKTRSRRYSDMGAIVLKYILEDLTGKSMEELMKEYIIKPCDMMDTGSCPTEKQRIVSNNYERKIIQNKYRCDYFTSKGICHDIKARILNDGEENFSGHAGVFSTADDMARFAQGIVSGKILRKYQYVIGKIRGSIEKGQQCFGLMSYCKNPILNNSEVYHPLSSRAFAFGGYTGNQITIDCDNEIFSFMASNRCHNRITMAPIDDFHQRWEDGENYICSKRFAWERDICVHKMLKLSLQYRLLEKLYSIKSE